MKMLLMNSCSSYSFKYHPFQYAGSAKPFQQSPVTRKYHFLHRSQRNHCSIKCSFQSSFSSNNENEDMIIRKKKTTVPLALQEDYSSKFQDENIHSKSFLDVFKNKLHAFYRVSRPFVMISYIIGTFSCSLLPVQSVAELTPAFFMEVVKCTIPTLLMTIFVATINQLTDVELDKVNKPYLPLASGDFSIGEGIAICIITTLTSLAMGVMLRSPPLVISLILRFIIGVAYTIDAPFLLWKGNPFMAAFTMTTLNAVLLQIPVFMHFQKYVLGHPVVFSKSLLFTAVFMAIHSIVIAFLKDVPDVEGDKEFGFQTLPVVWGKERVFSISVNTMLMAYGGAVLVGASSTSLLFKLVTMIGHSALGFILWLRSRTTDLSDPKSTYSFFIFVFQAIVLCRIFAYTLRTLRRGTVHLLEEIKSF